jgi:hypothetical protein
MAGKRSLDENTKKRILDSNHVRDRGDGTELLKRVVIK